jgi:hypothetical protein
MCTLPILNFLAHRSAGWVTRIKVLWKLGRINIVWQFSSHRVRIQIFADYLNCMKYSEFRFLLLSCVNYVRKSHHACMCTLPILNFLAHRSAGWVTRIKVLWKLGRVNIVWHFSSHRARIQIFATELNYVKYVSILLVRIFLAVPRFAGPFKVLLIRYEQYWYKRYLNSLA